VAVEGVPVAAETGRDKRTAAACILGSVSRGHKSQLGTPYPAEAHHIRAEAEGNLDRTASAPHTCWAGRPWGNRAPGQERHMAPARRRHRHSLLCHHHIHRVRRIRLGVRCPTPYRLEWPVRRICSMVSMRKENGCASTNKARAAQRKKREQVEETHRPSEGISYSTLFIAAMAFWASASWV
jgi:hypothetical protein